MPKLLLPRAREARATLGLVGVCVVVFGWTFALAMREDASGSAILSSLWNLGAAEAFERSGGLVLTRVWLDGEWWRVLTAGLVHGSWLHLGLNTWALWDVGRWTERAWGPWRQIALFGVSSVGGCLASLGWAEAPIVVGASAGIFGVASALVVARQFGAPWIQAKLAPVAGRRLAFWLILWLVVGWQVPILANAGHLGGAVVGALLGLGLSRRGWRKSVGFGLATAVVACLALVARAPDFRPNYAMFTGLELLDRGDVVGGYGRLEQALEQTPDDPIAQNAAAYSLALQGIHLVRAEELSLASLESMPGRADFLDTLGWIYCRRGDTEAGLRALHEAEAASTLPIPEVSEHLIACASASIK